MQYLAIERFDRASVDGVFDHRRMSVERIASEVASWRVIAAGRAQRAVVETLVSLATALDEIAPEPAASPGMRARLQWNVSRLLAGVEISEPKR